MPIDNDSQLLAEMYNDVHKEESHEDSETVSSSKQVSLSSSDAMPYKNPYCKKKRQPADPKLVINRKLQRGNDSSFYSVA